MWKRCEKCNRPLVCKSNIWKIRSILAGCTVGTGLLGAAALPFIGFGAGGVVAGSAAASWQSSIGLVAAGSLFAALQSLGATGLGTVLFGSIGAALPLITSIAVKLDWCVNDCDPNLKVETVENTNNTDRVSIYQLRVTNLKRLDSVQSSELKLGNITLKMKVFKYNSDSLGISLHADRSCRSRMSAKLISTKGHWKSVQRLQIHNIEVDDELKMNKLVSWTDLFDAKNGFIESNAIHIKVEIKLKINAAEPVCEICFECMESQEISSVPCGHVFCSQCIRSWIREHNSCALCRAPATLIDLRRWSDTTSEWE